MSEGKPELTQAEKDALLKNYTNEVLTSKPAKPTVKPEANAATPVQPGTTTVRLERRPQSGDPFVGKNPEDVVIGGNRSKEPNFGMPTPNQPLASTENSGGKKK